MSTATREGVISGRLGDSPPRPDGMAKVQGSFAFSGDLSADGSLWGATLRSPHPYARIVRIDVSPAWRIDGVATVITAEDVPGKPTYGLISSDQPVFASDVVRYVGEPIAAVAADHPETCRRALEAIIVEYQVLTPLTDP
ncbi:MAG TPA: xanthine dehydrogenase subunit D, partial [Ilumatobacteraceae bacterium]|nr:xanthine dehydrogenase subunit D [Ilumatobacteraceae bacterium]